MCELDATALHFKRLRRCFYSFLPNACVARFFAFAPQNIREQPHSWWQLVALFRQLTNQETRYVDAEDSTSERVERGSVAQREVCVVDDVPFDEALPASVEENFTFLRVERQRPETVTVVRGGQQQRSREFTLGVTTARHFHLFRR